jgi:hypothetical protein
MMRRISRRILEKVISFADGICIDFSVRRAHEGFEIEGLLTYISGIMAHLTLLFAATTNFPYSLLTHPLDLLYLSPNTKMLSDLQGQAIYSDNPALHIGPFLMALFFDSIMFGAIIPAFVKWLTHSRQEKKWIKGLVVSWSEEMGLVLELTL